MPPQTLKGIGGTGENESVMAGEGEDMACCSGRTKFWENTGLVWEWYAGNSEGGGERFQREIPDLGFNFSVMGGESHIGRY